MPDAAIVVIAYLAVIAYGILTAITAAGSKHTEPAEFIADGLLWPVYVAVAIMRRVWRAL